MAKPTLSEISKLFKTDDKPTDFHYYGTVVSADTDNRTYEVSINRDKNITVEAARLVGAHVGDTVMVTVMANGYATVTGRVGGDTDASDAQRKADSASDAADKAQAKAVSALSKAAAAEQLSSQAEQNAKRSADAAESAEQNARNSADYANESKTASEQAQQAAETAQQNAAASQTASETAQQNAAGSQTAAEAARDRAAVAEGYADTAQKQAAKAEKEASAANSYAVGALNSLSTTQDIIGVLSWVEESIKYVWDYPPTAEDKEYDPSKQYYTVIGKRVIDPIETDYDKYYILDSESEPASKTGNIVTFDSDLDNFPLNSLTATIDPKQDLNGYDKPWVGGAGKNLLDYSEPISVTAGAQVQSTIGSITLEAGQYTFSCKQSVMLSSVTRNNFILVRNGQAIYGSPASNTSSDRISNTFNITEAGEYEVKLWMHTPSAGVTCTEFQIEKGSSFTGYAPYSNICPISGWNEVEVGVNGINVFSGVVENGKWISDYATGETTNSTTNYNATDFIPIEPNTSYYMMKTGSSRNVWYDANKNAIPMQSWEIWDSAKVITSPSNARYIRFTVTNAYLDGFGLNYPSTDTDYHAYIGTTYTTDLPETVYGGTLDVVNGVLTVNEVGQTISGGVSLYGNYGVDNKPLFYFDLTTAVAPYASKNAPLSAKLISNKYSAIDTYAVTEMGNGQFRTKDTEEPTTTRIYIRDDRFTTASQINADLATTPLTIIGKLAEPRTIQLTPKQITTLLGTNNVWADSGDVTVEYWDGPVGYVTPTSSFDPTETYYTVKGSPVKIDESKQEEHGKGLYYVHDLTNAKEAMADFIKAHLALNDEGLYVLKGLNDWRVLVANDGVYIIDPQGRRVASYKDSITLGTSEGNSIRITSEAITFNIGDKTFAYVAQDKWFASNAEVSGAMYIGDYSLRQKLNGDFVLGRRR